MTRVVGRYREFAPCDALRPYVRAYFTFSPTREADLARRASGTLHVAARRATLDIAFGPSDPFSGPLFADGHASVVFNLGDAYRVDGLWDPNGARFGAHVIGAMTKGRLTSIPERYEIAGVYLRAGQGRPLLGLPVSELTDRITPLEQIIGSSAADARWESLLFEAAGDEERVGVLETILLDRMAKARRSPVGTVDVPGLASCALSQGGRMSVRSLAEAAGVSRQHLTRIFREEVGVSPKLYCRLARFRATLAHAARGKAADWAEAAGELGYADQSHMIAEFREFSGLTPRALTPDRYFHPFVEGSSAGVE